MFAIMRAPLSPSLTAWVWGTRRAFSAITASEPAGSASAASAAASAAASLFRVAGPAEGARSKGKGQFKRASEVMAAVREDAVARTFVKMAGFRPPLPDFRVGDAVEVLYAQEVAEAKPLAVKGTVMSMPRKGLDAKFTIINVRGRRRPLRLAVRPRSRHPPHPRAPPLARPQNMDGEWYLSTYVTSSPLLRGVKILQRNRVTEGVRLARRARLTYLKDANPNIFVVDDSTKDAVARQEEKEEKRRALKGKKKEKAASKGKGEAVGAAAAPAAGKGKEAKEAKAPAKAPAKK